MSDRRNMMKYARGDMPSPCLKPCLRTKVRLREVSNVLSHRGGRTLGLTSRMTIVSSSKELKWTLLG